MSDNQSLTPFQRNLARLRDQRGFNNKSLSLAAGLNETYVRDVIEKSKGAKRPSLDALRRLAKALHCRVEDLTAGDESEALSSPQRQAAEIAARLGEDELVHWLGLGKSLMDRRPFTEEPTSSPSPRTAGKEPNTAGKSDEGPDIATAGDKPTCCRRAGRR